MIRPPPTPPLFPYTPLSRSHPPLSEPHPLRRPRRAARSVDGGLDGARARAARHARLSDGLRARSASDRFSPPCAAARRAVVRPLGRELHLRHVVRAAWPRRDRRGPPSRICPARGPLARAPPEQGRGLGRDVRELRRLRVRGRRPVHSEPDRVGAARALRGRAHERTGRRARCQLLAANAARRWLVGGRALERDGLPAGLLSEVPPVRAVFPPLGSGNLPPRACLSDRSRRRCARSTPSAAGRSRCSIRSVSSAPSSRKRWAPSSPRRSRSGRSSAGSTTSATARS